MTKFILSVTGLSLSAFADKVGSYFKLSFTDLGAGEVSILVSGFILRKLDGWFAIFGSRSRPLLALEIFRFFVELEMFCFSFLTSSSTFSTFGSLALRAFFGSLGF